LLVYLLLKYIFKIDECWRNISIAGTIVLVTAQLIGAFSGVMFPIMLGPDVSDYNISCDPANLEIVIPDSLIYEEFSAWPNHSSSKSIMYKAYTVKISVDNLNPLRKYDKQVYITPSNHPVFDINVFSPVLKTGQSSELSISARLNDLHLYWKYPIVIQAIGADGKKRNCTISIRVISENEANSSEIWNNKGVALYNQGRYNESLKAYDKAIKISPRNAVIWTNKGAALASLGKYNDALEAYDKAIEIDPKYADAWYNKGVALDAQGKYDEAMQAYDKALEINPQYGDVWCNKGNYLEKQGKYDEAVKAYDKATEINPQDKLAWNNKGNALDNQGKHDEAIQAYNKAIEIDPQYTDAWNNKGIALDKHGNHDDAIQAFDKAIEINPQCEVAWNNKGVALGAQGKYDEAIQAYDRAIELKPDYTTPWINKALLSSRSVMILRLKQPSLRPSS